MTLSDPLKLLLLVAEKLSQLNIKYYVGGSVASSVYGFPRLTQDIDLIAKLHLFHIDKLVEAFQDEFYIDADMIREAIENQRSFNIVHYRSMMKIDIFILKKTDFASVEMERRRKEIIEEPDKTTIYFSSPEDLILEKLMWFKSGGEISDRQWQDVLGVLKVQANNIDFDYLNSWASKLGINELLKKATNESFQK